MEYSNDECLCVSCPVHQRVAHQAFDLPQLGRENVVYAAVKDGRLEIDDEGRIWRGVRRAENKHQGRLRIGVRINNRRFNTLAHRLVWFHFRGPIPPGLQVNHIDGDPTNNHPGNLELVTPHQNSLHRYHVLNRKNLRA